MLDIEFVGEWKNKYLLFIKDTTTANIIKFANNSKQLDNMVDYVPPPAKNKLPALTSEFKDNNEKGAFVNELLTVATKAMTDADEQYNQFQHKQAHSEYLVALDGFMHLMKVTKDDANF